MLTKLHFALPIAAATLLLSACSGHDEPAKQQASVEAEADENTASADQDYMLPPPISLASAFKNAGLPFVPNKTNPVDKKDTYSKKIDQLLNLGVYTTDLAYCAINNKTQEARDYLAAIQNLGNKVGLESVFSDKSLIEKFDKNLGNQQALEDLIYDIQDKSDAYLQDNDLRYLAAVEFAGAWAEGMYLGAEESRKKESTMGVAIVDQMVLLKNTIKGLQSHPVQDARLKEVIAMYENVLATYNGLESVKKAAKNVNFEAPKLTAAEFDALAQSIVSLRNGIVSPAQK